MVRNKKSNAIEVLDYFEEDSEDGFSEGEVNLGKTLSSFSFSPEPASVEALTDNRKIKTEANIATPAVDSEIYNIGRYYKLRYSTAKMLNEIKAAHSDVNVYMNTIVDEAVRHYYSCLFNKA